MNSFPSEPIPHIDKTHKMHPDFHSVASLQFGDLYTDGLIDFESNEWNWDYYNIEQKNRLNNKILDRFFYREIATTPYFRFRKEFIRTLNEIMPKYKKVYAIIDETNILQSKNKYGKNRKITSSFPQTLLNGQSDYASNGSDYEFEDLYNGDFLEKMGDLKNYDDVDVMILNDLEILFTPLLAVNFNGY